MLVLMAIEDILGDLGCTSITVAGNFDKALNLVKTGSFDLATLDVNLNGQQSYPIATALSERGVPFAFTTGYGEQSVAESQHDCMVLNKPYTRAQFVAVITALVEDGQPPALAA